MPRSGNPSSFVPAPAAGTAAPGVPPANGPASPAALTAAQLARMLGVPEEKVQEHIAAGAPVSAGGTVNLVHYAAWLNQRMAPSARATRPPSSR